MDERDAWMDHGWATPRGSSLRAIGRVNGAVINRNHSMGVRGWLGGQGIDCFRDEARVKTSGERGVGGWW